MVFICGWFQGSFHVGLLSSCGIASTSKVLGKGKGCEARHWGSSLLIQALMLDLDYGSYPVRDHHTSPLVLAFQLTEQYVTSSNTSLGAPLAPPPEKLTATLLVAEGVKMMA